MKARLMLVSICLFLMPSCTVVVVQDAMVFSVIDVSERADESIR